MIDSHFVAHTETSVRLAFTSTLTTTTTTMTTTASRPARTAPMLFATIVLSSSLGCSSSGEGGGGRVSSFPSADDVQSLMNSGASTSVSFATVVEPDVYTLVGPLPTRGGPVPLDDNSELLAKELRAIRNDLVVTDALSCAAREISLVHLAHGHAPSSRLERFIVGACGVTSDSVGLQSAVWDDDGGNSFDAFLARTKNERAEFLRGVKPSSREVGAAIVSMNGKVMMAVANVAGVANVQPFSLTPDAEGNIVIEGTTDVKGDVLGASITWGKADARPCALKPRVHLPKFGLICPTLNTDSTARIEAVVLEQGRVFGKMVLSTMVRPTGAEPRTIQGATYAVSDDDEREETLPTRFLEAVNAIRAEVNRPPLRLSTAQNGVATALSKPLFAALNKNEASADDIALAFLAGWNMDQGVIMNGDFGIGRVTSLKTSSLLEGILDRPVSRSVLFCATCDVLSVGVATDASSNVGGLLFAAWDLYESHDVDEDSTRVFKALESRRAKWGMLGVIPLVDERTREAARRIEESGDVGGEANDALQHAADVMKLAMNSYVIETNDLDEISFPHDLIDSPSVFVSVGVAFYKPVEDPWGRYVVVLISHIAEHAKTASLPKATTVAAR